MYAGRIPVHSSGRDVRAPTPRNLFDAFLVWGPGVLVNWVAKPLGADLEARWHEKSMIFMIYTRYSVYEGV